MDEPLAEASANMAYITALQSRTVTLLVEARFTKSAMLSVYANDELRHLKTFIDALKEPRTRRMASDLSWEQFDKYIGGKDFELTRELFMMAKLGDKVDFTIAILSDLMNHLRNASIAQRTVIDVLQTSIKTGIE